MILLICLCWLVSLWFGIIKDECTFCLCQVGMYTRERLNKYIVFIKGRGGFNVECINAFFMFYFLRRAIDEVTSEHFVVLHYAMSLY